MSLIRHRLPNAPAVGKAAVASIYDRLTMCSLVQHESALSLVEEALVIALIVVVCLAFVQSYGMSVITLFGAFVTQLQTAMP